MSSLSERLNNIDWEQVRKDRYKEELENLNNFSYWYPKVQNCGIPMVKSRIYQIPFDMWKLFNEADENPSAYDKCIDWLKETMQNNDISKHAFYNIKNGCFSNKFDARYCNVQGVDIPKSFMEIQMLSQYYDTGGTTELIVRDYLPFNHEITPTIYNGLPLRPEFRVFVDFDTNEVLYIVNYWDYDYCIKGMYNATDNIVFNYMKDELLEKFDEHKSMVIQLVKEKLLKHNQEQTDKLTGQWSVDIMLWADKTYYLIDMAVANRSAYYERGRKDEY